MIIKKHDAIFFEAHKRAVFHCIREKKIVPIQLPSLIQGPSMRAELEKQNKVLTYRTGKREKHDAK